MTKYEYKIVKQTTVFDSLAKKVNKELNDGWELQGGVGGWGSLMIQAMIKKIEE